jgi:hypothetical protein
MPFPFPFALFSGNEEVVSGCDPADAAVAGSWNGAALGRSSLKYDGSNDYVSSSWSDVIDFQFNDPFSFAFWMRSTGTGLYYLVQKAQIEDPNVANYGIVTFINAGKITFQIAGNSNNTDGYVTNNLQINGTHTAINNGDWHHVGITYTGNNNTSGMNIYIDGGVSAKSAVRNDAIGNSIVGRPLSIGRRERADTGGSADLHYTGSLDELAIWNVTLGASAVADLYNGGSGAVATAVSSSNLALYYNFNDGPGNSTAADQTSQGHVGTLVNMITGSCD